MDFPTTKPIKDEIREAIGVTATFVIRGEEEACSICSASGYYDPINKVSTDPFCPECSGEYWITDDISSGITSHVRWRYGDDSDYGMAGQTLEGDCIITIDIEALTVDQVSKVKEIIVDSRKVAPYRKIYRGVPTRDRIRFVCREYKKE